MDTIGGMATFKGRIDIISDAIRSLAPQIDQLFIYCNDEESYNALKNYPKNVKKYLGENITDRGKFCFCEWYKGNDIVYFTVDDDLIYPIDYVKKTLMGLRRHDYKTIVGHHGKKFMGDHLINYYADLSPEQKKFSYVFDRIINDDYPVDLLGTGCMAFNIKYFTPDELIYDIMTDIEICCMAKRLDKKMVVLKHGHEWIQSNSKAEGIWSVYNHCRTNGCDKQTELIRKYFYNENKSLVV